MEIAATVSEASNSGTQFIAFGCLPWLAMETTMSYELALY